MVNIESDNLILREFLSSDLEAVYEYASDPQVCRYLDWGPNSTRECKEFIKKSIASQREKPRTAFHLAITERSTGQVIGGMGLLLVGFPINQALIGYVLNQRYWGKGIVSESVKAMLDFGFTDLKLHRISATCDLRNVASYRVMEKCGMRREGHFIQDKFFKDGWRDTLTYSILASEWAKTNESN